MNIDPLIFIPSPRDIKIFTESVSKLTKYDKYWVKYHAEPDAYRKARTLFLENNYTHFVILPDDLIVTPEHIDLLIEDIKSLNFSVISGITNVDIREVNKGKYCVSEKLPNTDNLSEDSYDWFTEQKRELYLHFNRPIIQLKHIGFPLTFIRRDIIEMLKFRNLSNYNCCIDVQFSFDCDNHRIPIYVDLRVIGDHLKRRDGVYDDMGLGNKNPITKLERKDGSIEFI